MVRHIQTIRRQFVVTKQMVAPWNKTTLPTLLSKYDLKDIFNADVKRFFLTLCHFKGQKCSGGKNSKLRLTGMAAGNAIGEKLPIFVIGKFKTPCCFKHIKIYHVKTNHKRRLTVKYLKNGCANLTEHFE